MEGNGRFEVIAKMVRVDADLNSRDARLSRLADDPILLKQALSEGPDQTFPAILRPSTADAVAMVSGRNPPDGSHSARAHHPYSKAQTDSGTRTSLHPERYDGAAKPVDAGPTASRMLMQFAMLAASTFCFLTLAAVLLFAG